MTMAVLSRRGPVPFMFTAMLLIIMLQILEVTAWSPPAGQQSKTSTSTSTSRRAFFVAGITSIGFVLGGANNEALAVQERNELLCGTGFFTNIWQYKCTDIGDIEDEGKSKSVTAEEDAKMDTLMGKLGMDMAESESSGGENTGSSKIKSPQPSL
jgi:hypothetical protein